MENLTADFAYKTSTSVNRNKPLKLPMKIGFPEPNPGPSLEEKKNCPNAHLRLSNV